ncbi:unnamed protein product [Choristocarpus tenellus]
MYDMDLLLDIKCEIYKVKEADRLTLVLYSTLDISGKPDEGIYRPLGDEVTLVDKFDYVMHGRIFKCAHAGDSKVQILASFGGLLLHLTGDQGNVANIQDITGWPSK